MRAANSLVQQLKDDINSTQDIQESVMEDLEMVEDIVDGTQEQIVQVHEISIACLTLLNTSKLLNNAIT